VAAISLSCPLSLVPRSPFVFGSTPAGACEADRLEASTVRESGAIGSAAPSNNEGTRIETVIVNNSQTNINTSVDVSTAVQFNTAVVAQQAEEAHANIVMQMEARHAEALKHMQSQMAQLQIHVSASQVQTETIQSNAQAAAEASAQAAAQAIAQARLDAAAQIEVARLENDVVRNQMQDLRTQLRDDVVRAFAEGQANVGIVSTAASVNTMPVQNSS